jgi:glycerophosphoryl diester phosphodiesterase
MAPVLIGHRGCPLQEPENSLAGIRRTRELGLDGVEIDIHRSLDGVPVVFHDSLLGRMTGWPGPLRLYPWFVLRRLRLHRTRERIPALGQALDALPSGMFMAIEVKASAAAPATLRAVRERKLERRVLLWSYRERALSYFAERAPEIERALLRDDTDPEGLRRYLDDALRLANAISVHWSAATPQLVGEAHDRGLRVYSMTRDLETVAKKAAAGLDGIVTDYPAEVRAILQKAAAS